MTGAPDKATPFPALPIQKCSASSEPSALSLSLAYSGDSAHQRFVWDRVVVVIPSPSPSLPLWPSLSFWPSLSLWPFLSFWLSLSFWPFLLFWPSLLFWPFLLFWPSLSLWLSLLLCPSRHPSRLRCPSRLRRPSHLCCPSCLHLRRPSHSRSESLPPFVLGPSTVAVPLSSDPYYNSSTG